MSELLESAMSIFMVSNSKLSKYPHFISPSTIHNLQFLPSLPNSRTHKAKPLISDSSCNQQAFKNDPQSPLICDDEVFNGSNNSNYSSNISSKGRVFFLDVNPLCYKGSTPSLQSFAHWITLFFSRVSVNDPVIAVLDGERGNDYRRELLPSYKANRRRFVQNSPSLKSLPRTTTFRRSHKIVTDVLQKCNVPVVKIEGHEADDVVATLVEQVLQKCYRVVIASPDKDFKQLISDDVQIVMPLPEFNRWSFYTMKHYVAQYNCDPQSDLSLRCFFGDETDGVPGIQHLVPGFGRKTAIKLLKKHGSLDNLLSAAAVRTIGKQYAQEALINNADFLRRNYRVLSLKRDIDVHIENHWLSPRDAQNDSVILSNFMDLLGETRNLNHQKDPIGVA